MPLRKIDSLGAFQMKKSGLAFGLAVVLAAFPAASAGAKRVTIKDFTWCDGRGTPREVKPGKVAKPWGQWGDSQQLGDLLIYGPNGVKACDAALSNPLMVDAYWQRRATLLQAKAMHQLAAKDDKGALTTIDQVDALIAQHPDSYLEQSLGLGDQAVRAIALYRAEQAVAAHAALTKIDAARPYSGSMVQLTRSIEMIFNYSRDANLKLMREEAPLNPQVLHLLFWLSMSYGNFEDALDYADQLTFDLPRGRGNWTSVNDKVRQYKLIADRATAAGAKAYAQMALGRPDAATVTMAAAKAEVDDAIQPPPPPPDGGKLSKQVQADYDQRKAAGAKAMHALEEWANAMRARTLAPKTAFRDITSLGQPLSGDAIIIRTDLLRQFKPQDMAEATVIQNLIQKFEDANDEERRQALGLNFRDLAKALPTIETGDSLPKMRSEGLNLWRTNLEGYAVPAADDPELFNVRFGGLAASVAMLEEASMLIAAREAQKRGKDGFVLEALQRVKRSITTYGMYGISYGASAAGYEIRMLVRPVDLSALPPQLQKGRWRVFKAADVIAALADKYPMQR